MCPQFRHSESLPGGEEENSCHFCFVAFLFFFAHLAWAARRADSLRSSGVMFLALFFPPCLPNLAKYSRVSFGHTSISRTLTYA